MSTHILWYCDLCRCLVNVHVVPKVTAVVLSIGPDSRQVAHAHVVAAEVIHATHHRAAAVLAVVCPRIDVVAHSTASVRTATSSFHVVAVVTTATVVEASISTSVTETAPVATRTCWGDISMTI